MDFLYEFAAPVVVGICLCVGYILKHLVPGKSVDRFIPLLMGAIGVVLTAWSSTPRHTLRAMLRTVRLPSLPM